MGAAPDALASRANPQCAADTLEPWKPCKAARAGNASELTLPATRSLIECGY